MLFAFALTFVSSPLISVASSFLSSAVCKSVISAIEWICAFSDLLSIKVFNLTTSLWLAFNPKSVVNLSIASCDGNSVNLLDKASKSFWLAFVSILVLICSTSSLLAFEDIWVVRFLISSWLAFELNTVSKSVISAVVWVCFLSAFLSTLACTSAKSLLLAFSASLISRLVTSVIAWVCDLLAFEDNSVVNVSTSFWFALVKIWFVSVSISSLVALLLMLSDNSSVFVDKLWVVSFKPLMSVSVVDNFSFIPLILVFWPCIVLSCSKSLALISLIPVVFFSILALYSFSFVSTLLSCSDNFSVTVVFCCSNLLSISALFLFIFSSILVDKPVTWLDKPSALVSSSFMLLSCADNVVFCSSIFPLKACSFSFNLLSTFDDMSAIDLLYKLYDIAVSSCSDKPFNLTIPATVSVAFSILGISGISSGSPLNDFILISQFLNVISRSVSLVDLCCSAFTRSSSCFCLVCSCSCLVFSDWVLICSSDFLVFSASTRAFSCWTLVSSSSFLLVSLSSLTVSEILRIFSFSSLVLSCWTLLASSLFQVSKSSFLSASNVDKLSSLLFLVVSASCLACSLATLVFSLSTLDCSLATRSCSAWTLVVSLFCLSSSLEILFSSLVFLISSCEFLLFSSSTLFVSCSWRSFSLFCRSCSWLILRFSLSVRFCSSSFLASSLLFLACSFSS